MTGHDRDDAVRDLESAITDLVGVIRRAHLVTAQRIDPRMSPMSFKVFSVVARCGPVTLSDLASQFVADKGLMSRTITELEELGLVERRQSPEDRRIRLIEATDAGRTKLSAAREPSEVRLQRALADWPVADIDRLAGLLRSLAANETP